MLKTHLKLALRNVRKHAGYSAINIVGLAIGLACCFLISMYVMDELSYDRFHTKADRIYRVVNEVQLGDQPKHWAWSPMRLAAALEERIPEVEKAVRLTPRGGDRLVGSARQAKRFYESNLLYADANLFDVFDFPLDRGNEQTALVEPYTLVITQDMARKYFGDSDPIGQSLVFYDDGDAVPYRVTGVLEAVPHNSHVQFDALISFATLSENASRSDAGWFSLGYVTYVLLDDEADVATVDEKLQGFIAQVSGDDDAWYTPYLQPLTDIRLNREHLGIGGQVDVRYVYAFTAIAFMILIIACINYVNLATARATKRAREVGVRKVLGANRRMLVRQFLIEAMLFSLCAVALGWMIVELATPAFDQLTGKVLSTGQWSPVTIVVVLLLCAVVTGSMAGLYPALSLSRFSPLRAMAGSTAGTVHPARGSFLRRTLVVGQFAATLVLVIGTFAIYQQLAYLHHARLGYEREHVVVIRLRDDALEQQVGVLKQAIAGVPGVVTVAASSGTPVSGHGRNGVWSKEEDEARMTTVMAVDYDYLETMRLSLAEGRWFDRDTGTDAAEGFVVNQAAVNAFGWQQPLGVKLNRNNQKGRIIGVVDDFHFASLHEPIAPLVLYMNEDDYWTLSARIDGADVAGTLAGLGEAWRSVAPDNPFEYHFLDEQYDALYDTEQRTGAIAATFAGMAVVIACLGLFGLAAFAAEQRTKEIGVRKVLGATASRIVGLLVREFVILVLVAFVLAAPLAFFLMSHWLNDFAYHITLSWILFAAATLLTLFLALLTVGYQALRAATADPVKALRYE